MRDTIYQMGGIVFTFRGMERTGCFQVLDFLISEHKNYRLEKELPKNRVHLTNYG